jgi:hypothetical protein
LGDLNIHAGSPIFLEEFRGRKGRHQPDIRRGEGAKTIRRWARVRPDEDEGQVLEQSSGRNEGLESLPTEVHVRNVSNGEHVRSRAFIGAEERRVESERNGDDLGSPHTGIACDFVAKGVVDEEDAIGAGEGVSTSRGDPGIDVRAVAHLGDLRRVDATHDHDALPMEETSQSTRTIGVVQGEPGKRKV